MSLSLKIVFLEKELLYIKQECPLYPRNEVVVMHECQALGSESDFVQGTSGSAVDILRERASIVA